MLRIDFNHITEPFDFIRELMPNHAEEEIKEAHDNLCEYLNLELRIFNRKLKNGEIDLDS